MAVGKTFHPNRAQQHSTVGGALAAGAALVNGTPATTVVVLAGGARGRVYFKATAAGTLALTPIRSQGLGAGSGSPPANLLYTATLDSEAVLANAEKVLEFDLFGEHGGELTYSPTGDGVVTYCDICLA